MGLRLLVLGWWTPKYLIRRELKNIYTQTTAALKALLPKNTAKQDDGYQNQPLAASIQQQRAAMAQTQAKLVEALEAAVGREEAVKRGRETLFLVGQSIGKQTRDRLGVGDNPKDLVKAAKILYRVLGIEFHLEWVDDTNAQAIIDRCALAQQYSALTCEVLSATDEGVINGLQPNVTMKFNKYLTSGCKNCTAAIHFNAKEATQ
jgi:hypothetical protein